MITRTKARANGTRTESDYEFRTRLERERLEREAAFQAERDAYRHAEEMRAKRLASRTKERATSRTMARERWHAIVPRVPLVLVNAIALVGQFGWACANLTGVGTVAQDGTPNMARVVVACVFAAALESISLVLQFHSDRAVRNGDSAAGLLIATFAVSALVASINYSHYATATYTEGIQDFFGDPNPMAVSFALFSFVSPWLWRIQSRAQHREVLRIRGEIDERGVKLAGARKFWHPIKSLRVMRMAAWNGTRNPREAVEQWNAAQDAKRSQLDMGAKSKSKSSDAIPHTVCAQARLKSKTRAVGLPENPQDDPETLVGVPVSRPIERGSGDVSERLRAHPRYTEGVRIYLESGKSLSQRALANALDMRNRELATQIIKDVRNNDNNRLSQDSGETGTGPEA